MVSPAHLPASLVARARDAALVLGPVGLVRLAPLWLLRPRFLVATRDLRQPAPPVPTVEGLRWEPLAEPAIPELLALDPRLTAAAIRRKCRAGQACHILRRHASVVYWRWETTRPTPVPEIGLVLLPRPGEVFVVESFTPATHRGAGYLTVASAHCIERYRGDGLARYVSLTAPWNTPARRVLHRAGAATAGTVSGWHLGAWWGHHATGAVKLDGRGHFWVEAAP